MRHIIGKCRMLFFICEIGVLKTVENHTLAFAYKRS